MRYLPPFSVFALFTIVAVIAVPARAAVPETEIREFAIQIGGTSSGQFVMKITKQDDGVESVQSQANTTFKHFLGTYTYSFKGTEHWKNGRILRLDSSCNDDGKKFEVSATAGPQALQLKVNGKERTCNLDAWTTTYWKLPDARFHNNTITLLDADTGKEFLAQLKYVGQEGIAIAGKNQTCYHFQVTGGPTSPCDLWFDGQHRLVRQEFTDQGKKVLFVLTSIKR
jgi:Family of unknown function (DUF6134)